jgi:hypothetical protein
LFFGLDRNSYASRGKTLLLNPAHPYAVGEDFSQHTERDRFFQAASRQDGIPISNFYDAILL